MSHNFPYRRPSDTDLRPEAGSYSSAERRHVSPDLGFYRPPQESFSSSYRPPSSSRAPASAPWPQDNALSILSSCGLEPSDLALLAELPEDVLTVEALPHVLQQIKGKKGTTRTFPTSTSSSSSSSFHRPSASSSGDWNRPVQYPLGHVASSPLLCEQGHRGSSRTSSSFRTDPTPLSSSSASRYVVDFPHRSGASEYGKTQDRPSFSSAAQRKRSHPAGFSESRLAPPEDQKPGGSRHESHSSSSRSSSRHTAAAAAPSKKSAMDFHGTCPTVFPYSCSLCDITVLSEKVSTPGLPESDGDAIGSSCRAETENLDEKRFSGFVSVFQVWTKHINGTQHAEGQLSLLQQ